jgi:hypothetical protein
VGGIGAASLLADVGHEIPTSLLPSLLTSTLGAPAAALGLIEGVADGLAGAARFAGGALADDPQRRRAVALGGYGTTAGLSGLIGVATAVWQVAVLRSAAWFARGLRVPARNALLAVAALAYAIRAAQLPRTREPGRSVSKCARSRRAASAGCSAPWRRSSSATSPRRCSSCVPQTC